MSSRSSLQAELERYQRGEITFDTLAHRTQKTWVALATQLLSRWKCTAAVSIEDVQQQLLLAAWRCIPNFDPSRGKSLHQYVIYNAYDKAKKWVHKQRNAYRRDDKAPSRVPVPLSALGLEEHAEERLLSTIATVPDQEQEIIQRELEAERRLRLHQAIAFYKYDDLAFMHYQKAGSVEAAAENIQASDLARFVLGAHSLDSARAVVERSLERAAAAVAGAA